MAIDINTAVRFLDDVIDRNPKTNDLCPGKIDGKKLIQIGVQKERRILKRLFKPIKHIIYRLEGTREIWYKNNNCYPAAVKMGFSLSEMGMDRRSIPMEKYAHAFLEPQTFIPILNAIGKDWLARNDFVLT